MLPAGFAARRPPPGEAEREPNAWLAEKLGDDPFAYVTRFRIVEDRGKRPAMFSTDRSAEFEYVVLAEVNLDLDAIRAKMETLGLAEHGARGPAREVDARGRGRSPSYQPLALVQRDARARSRRALGACRSSSRAGAPCSPWTPTRTPRALVASLSRRAPEGLRVAMVEQGARRARPCASSGSRPRPPPAAAADGRESRPPIDTSERNRYCFRVLSRARERRLDRTGT